MAWTQPTVSEFKAFFNRDFNYAPDSDPTNLDYIGDSDISKAISEALINFNTTLFGENDEKTIVFMYLAAYYLVENIKASSQGIGSQFNFPITSKSVGSVSAGYQIPDRILKNPQFAMYASNAYGVRYIQYAEPWTIGNIRTVAGQTNVP